MRYAILSDIHANLEALTAVLARIDDLRADRVVCLGDVVGYYTDANACVELLAAKGAQCVAGNHDRAAVGLTGTGEFNRTAARAIAWTAPRLTPASRSMLAGFPTARLVDGAFLAVHGALHPLPNEWFHMSTRRRVLQSFAVLARSRTARIGFFGHTHRPAVHRLRFGHLDSQKDSVVSIRAGARYLINPGSVGQPRDGDLRASFLMYDARAKIVTLHRVPYDRAACLRKAAAEGLLAQGAAI